MCSQVINLAVFSYIFNIWLVSPIFECSATVGQYLGNFANILLFNHVWLFSAILPLFGWISAKFCQFLLVLPILGCFQSLGIFSRPCLNVISCIWPIHGKFYQSLGCSQSYLLNIWLIVAIVGFIDIWLISKFKIQNLVYNWLVSLIFGWIQPYCPLVHGTPCQEPLELSATGI